MNAKNVEFLLRFGNVPPKIISLIEVTISLRINYHKNLGILTCKNKNATKYPSHANACMLIQA